MKGGLRWPLGKESFGDRFNVVGVWDTKAKTFKSSSIRLKLRDADQFDFRTSTGEVAKEVSMKMTGIKAHFLVSSVYFINDCGHTLIVFLFDNFKT